MPHMVPVWVARAGEAGLVAAEGAVAPADRVGSPLPPNRVTSYPFSCGTCWN